MSWPESDGIDLDNVHFKQDSASCCSCIETINLLWEKIP